LTRNEWGNIRFIGGSSYGYRQDQLLYPIPDRYMETCVASVKAAGGWSNMDYLIEMEKEAIQKDHPSPKNKGSN
jgi:hypothetical protein